MKLIDIDKRQRIDDFKQFMYVDLTNEEVRKLIDELKKEFINHFNKENLDVVEVSSSKFINWVKII